MSGDPFQIYQVAGYGTGTLGLCKQPSIDADFADIAAWNPSVVVTLTHEDEFPDTDISLPLRFLKTDYNWLHLPITDFGVPARKDRVLWQAQLDALQTVLQANNKVLIHCKGGNGRSGMVLLKLLTLQGEAGHSALARLRAIRAGAVETDAQFNWATTAL